MRKLPFTKEYIEMYPDKHFILMTGPVDALVYFDVESERLVSSESGDTFNPLKLDHCWIIGPINL